MSHTTCSFWIPPSVLTLNAPTNDRTHTHTHTQLWTLAVIMQGKWLCHTLGLAQKTQPDRFGFWSADLPFSGKTESQSVAAVKQLEKKKHFSAAFFLAFRPFWMKRHLHSTTHTHTHTRPHAVSYKDGTSVIKTNIGGDRRPVRTPIKNTVRAQVCVWVGVSSGSRFPPLKGCLFAKKEEDKQPRPHKHTHTHNPKSRRVSPMNITEREWGSEEGSAAICCIMTHSLWVYQLSICITPSQSACCHTRPECLSSFPQITRYDASS